MIILSKHKGQQHKVNRIEANLREFGSIHELPECGSSLQYEDD